MTWHPPAPGDPCRSCGAIVQEDQHPVRYATTDSCAACGMAPSWSNRCRATEARAIHAALVPDLAEPSP